MKINNNLTKLLGTATVLVTLYGCNESGDSGSSGDTTPKTTPPTPTQQVEVTDRALLFVNGTDYIGAPQDGLIYKRTDDTLGTANKDFTVANLPENYILPNSLDIKDKSGNLAGTIAVASSNKTANGLEVIIDTSTQYPTIPNGSYTVELPVDGTSYKVSDFLVGVKSDGIACADSLSADAGTGTTTNYTGCNGFPQVRTQL